MSPPTVGERDRPGRSALIAATTWTDGESVALRRRMAAADCHAPHLIDAELGSVVRRMTLCGQLAPELANTLFLASPRLVTRRTTTAARWPTPLITADARLASAPHLPCTPRWSADRRPERHELTRVTG